MLWNKGGWIQNRANTLALWCMFAQVFPLFQDTAPFNVLPTLYPSTYAVADMAAGAPASVNPVAQGVISIISLAVNVLVFAFIIKRAKKAGVNPYTHDVFTDQKDYIEACSRLAEGEMAEEA